MKHCAILAGLVIFLAPHNATALQLTNRDTIDHTLIVAGLDEGEKQELKASPSDVIEGICETGCTITMPDGQEYEFEGNEIVSIEEGLIFLDGPYDLIEPSEIIDEGEEAATGAAN